MKPAGPTRMKPCIICEEERPHGILFSRPADYEYGVSCDPHAVIRCSSCGLVSLDPMPTQEQLRRYYPDDYSNYDESSPSALRRILERFYADSQVRLVRNLIGPQGKVLDVGCSTGKLIGLLEKNGTWTGHGIDFKEDVAKLGRSRGRKIFTGTLETCSLPADTYDLVLLNHMLEHADQPVSFLQEVSRVLKPGGKVFIETPNTECLDFSLFQDRWGCLHYPRHTYLFSRRNIEKLLLRCGFQETRIDYSLHTCGWALGLQNTLSAHIRIRKRYGRMAIYPLFLVGFVPCTLSQSLLKRATVLRVVAEKPA